MRWLRALFRRDMPDREIGKELQFHLDQRVEDYLGQGLSPDEARRRARAEFGGVQQVAEQCREVHRLRWLDGLSRDLRISIRTLRRAPGFSVVAVATLALGIGANSAVFSAIDTVLLRPLPFPDGDRLMRLRQRQDRTSESLIAPVRLEDWNRLSSTFEAITGYSRWTRDRVRVGRRTRRHRAAHGCREPGRLSYILRHHGDSGACRRAVPAATARRHHQGCDGEPQFRQPLSLRIVRYGAACDWDAPRANCGHRGRRQGDRHRPRSSPCRLLVLQRAQSDTRLPHPDPWRSDGVGPERAPEDQGARTAPIRLRHRAAGGAN